jgi:hypothetical protein
LIKQCEVLSYNPYSKILAFKYGKENVQITIDKALDKNIKIVNIKLENNKYLLTDEKENKEEIVKSKNKNITNQSSDIKTDN